jgi:hypothetical protein
MGLAVPSAVESTHSSALAWVAITTKKVRIAERPVFVVNVRDVTILLLGKERRILSPFC